MNHRFYLGESKEYMINPTTKITYNEYMMIIDFNLGSYKQSSYLFSKQELVSAEELLPVYSLELPQEIKHKIIKNIEIDNLKHNIIMLIIEEGIEVVKWYLEQKDYEAGPSYTHNSDNDEIEILSDYFNYFKKYICFWTTTK